MQKEKIKKKRDNTRLNIEREEYGKRGDRRKGKMMQNERRKGKMRSE